MDNFHFHYNTVQRDRLVYLSHLMKHIKKKAQSYLHQHRLAEFLPVYNFYGNFLTCDTVDSQLHKAWSKRKKKEERKEILSNKHKKYINLKALR